MALPDKWRVTKETSAETIRTVKVSSEDEGPCLTVGLRTQNSLVLTMAGRVRPMQGIVQYAGHGRV